MKVSKTIAVIERQAKVGNFKISLIRMSKDGVPTYGVSYPKKVGGENTSMSETAHFLNKIEAEEFYHRMVDFFS